MNLRKEYTTKTEYNSRPFGDIVLYCGIVDNDGIDLIYKSTDNFNPNYLDLRCRFNINRNARIFVCAIKKKYDFNKKNYDPLKLYKKLKQVSINFNEGANDGSNIKENFME